MAVGTPNTARAFRFSKLSGCPINVRISHDACGWLSSGKFRAFLHSNRFCLPGALAIDPVILDHTFVRFRVERVEATAKANPDGGCTPPQHEAKRLEIEPGHNPTYSEVSEYIWLDLKTKSAALQNSDEPLRQDLRCESTEHDAKVRDTSPGLGSYAPEIVEAIYRVDQAGERPFSIRSTDLETSRSRGKLILAATSREASCPIFVAGFVTLQGCRYSMRCG